MGNFIEGINRTDLPVGTQYGIRHGQGGIPSQLPELTTGKCWVQFDHNEMGRMYIVEEVTSVMEPDWKAEAKRLDGVTESQAGRIKYLEEENKNMKSELEILYTIKPSEETEKECGMTPEYVETENLHKERMRLENEELELNNKAKRNALTKEVTERNDNQRLNAYAQQVRDQQAEIIKLRNQLAAKDCEADYVDYSIRHSPISAKFHTDRLYKNAIWLWGVIVAFGINEVIQWLTR